MRAWTNWIWTSTITACCVSFLMFYACQSSYDSISSKDKLPATSEANAAGYDDENDIIVIFGGYDWPQQFIQFKNNEFIFHDSSYLPSAQDISGDGQNYFQLNDTLWMLNQQGTHLITASTHPPYDVTIPSVTIPILVDNNGCLAMTHHHIFIVGGGTTKNCESHDSVQIYDMINGKWLSGVPSLPTTRMSMACYAVDGTLYAIGGIGDNCNQYYDSILTLNISDAALADISSQQWQVAPSTLNTPSEGSCIVKHRNDLIVIGGKDIDSNRLKDVNVINTLTGECFLAGTLSIGTSYPACIIHETSNTLYIFGGQDATRSWQFINLPTMGPTVDPTTNPSNSPTQFPTFNPTESPTTNPSSNPTFNPTFNPTQNPSLRPSLPPSSNPTVNPTLKPSSDPSLSPTDSATVSEPTMVHATLSHTTTVTIAHDTAGATSKSPKRAAEFTMDILVILVAVLCLITVLVIGIICGILKKKTEKHLKQEIKILHLNRSESGMENVAKTANSNDQNETRCDLDNAESSSSFTFGEQVNEGKATTTMGDVSIAAMIADKIVLGIISTNQGSDDVVQKDGEKDGIELAKEGEDSDSLCDNHDTTGATAGDQT
eukprot:456977_1